MCLCVCGGGTAALFTAALWCYATHSHTHTNTHTRVFMKLCHISCRGGVPDVLSRTPLCPRCPSESCGFRVFQGNSAASWREGGWTPFLGRLLLAARGHI